MDTKSLCFDNTITRWDEGLPLGNGDLGCLIWDRADRLRFSLDKGGLWDCSDPPEAQADFTWQNMQTLIHQGKWRALSKKYDDCYNRPTPTKLPAGKLILDLGETEEVRSRLDLMTAEATVQSGSTVLRALIAANAPYGLIQINKPGVSLRIENPAYGSGKKPLFAGTGGTVQSLKNLVYPKAAFYEETVGEDRYRWFVQPTNDRFYGIVTAVRQQDGQTLIAYTVGVGESVDFVKESKELLSHALRGGYAAAHPYKPYGTGAPSRQTICRSKEGRGPPLQSFGAPHPPDTAAHGGTRPLAHTDVEAQPVEVVPRKFRQRNDVVHHRIGYIPAPLAAARQPFEQCFLSRHNFQSPSN